MHHYDEVRLEKLMALAHERFNTELQAVEERVLRESCSAEEHAPAEGDITERPESGWQGPVLRFVFLRWLVSDPDVPKYVHSQALTISHVRFDEDLDFSNYDVTCALAFSHVRFEKKLNLFGAKLEHLFVVDCTLCDDVIANHLQLRGSLFFRRVQAQGLLNLNSSRIAGQVEFDETELTRAESSLEMTGAVVRGKLDLTDHFRSAGEVNLTSVRVAGSVSLKGAKLAGLPDSLTLDGARIEGNVILRDGFEAAGTVRLMSAEIGHWLNMNGARLTSPDLALTLEACKIEGHALFKEGFHCAGEIQMSGARVGRSLVFSGAQLTHLPVALLMNHSIIGDDCMLNASFVSEGQIRMLGGEIRGDLNFSNAQLKGLETMVLFNNLLVQGTVHFSSNFVSAGCIDLCGIDVRGGLYFLGAKLNGPEFALLLHRATIHNSFYFDEDSEAAGKIVLHSSTVGGQFAFECSMVGSLKCQNCTLKELYWKKMKSPDKSTLNLSGTHITLLRDEAASWPAPGNLTLNNLTVDEFETLNPQRLNWLNKQPTENLSEAQPWTHVAKHLRDKGYTNAAKRAIYELRRHQAQARPGKRRLHGVPYFWRLLVARLEERPQRILLSVTACVLLGTSVFWPYRAHFSETSDAAYEATHRPRAGLPDKSGSYPRFEPMVYALENTLPIVHLGQDDRWAPDKRGTGARLYWILAGTRWFLILAGWAQGIVLAAALDMRFRS